MPTEQDIPQKPYIKVLSACAPEYLKAKVSEFIKQKYVSKVNKLAYQHTTERFKRCDPYDCEIVNVTKYSVMIQYELKN